MIHYAPSFALVRTIVGVAAAAALVGGCTSGKNTRSDVVAKASETQANELLGKVKTLEGEWTLTGPDGKPGSIIFKTSSAGSVVRETMFPGQPHEMTNVYHMDGPTCVVTHYCAAGNQPRMRAAKLDGQSIAFEFDSVTNLTASDEPFMGAMKLTFVDQNNLKQTWKHYVGGKVDNEFTFDLHRKN